MLTRIVERVVIGTSLAIGASVLLPIAKTTLVSVGRAGGKVATGLFSVTRSAANMVKEEVEDIVAEAQFERMRQQIDREIMKQEG